MSIIIKILVYLIISILINFLSSLMGSSEYAVKRGYVGMTDISKKTTLFTYSYNILLGPINILIFATIFKLLHLDFLITDIYLLPIVYFLFRIFLVVIYLDRWQLLNKTEFFSMHIISMILSYLFYISYIQMHSDQLLIVPTDLVSELWLVAIAYFIGVVFSIQDKGFNFPKNVDDYIEKKYKILFKKYTSLLEGLNNDEKWILFSIMIYEDYQRPQSIRVFERFFHIFHITSSTGIMQIQDFKRTYTDEESIIYIRDKFENLDNDKKNLKSLVFEIYNQTPEYFDSVEGIYNLIKEINLK